jgi:hypothetical protein
MPARRSAGGLCPLALSGVREGARFLATRHPSTDPDRRKCRLALALRNEGSLEARIFPETPPAASVGAGFKPAPTTKNLSHLSDISSSALPCTAGFQPAKPVADGPIRRRPRTSPLKRRATFPRPYRRRIFLRRGTACLLADRQAGCARRTILATRRPGLDASADDD